MRLLSLGPEPSASANSAIRACWKNNMIKTGYVSRGTSMPPAKLLLYDNLRLFIVLLYSIKSTPVNPYFCVAVYLAHEAFQARYKNSGIYILTVPGSCSSYDYNRVAFHRKNR